MNNDFVYSRIRAEIDLDAVKENVHNLQALLNPGVKTCAVIKADGYGHGAVPIARVLKKNVDWFATATIDEAINLRMHNITNPILVLGFIHPANTFAAISNDIRQTVFDMEGALRINEAAKDMGRIAKVHIKVDTGMGRIGFAPDESSAQEIEKICSLENIEVEGIFTHFFMSDGENVLTADRQLEEFEEFIEKLHGMGIDFAVRHCSNSAATTRMPYANMDMVRMGVSIYGLYPSEHVKSLELRPAMKLLSHVVYVKEVPAGTGISYGATFVAQRPTKVATISAGYADGYSRRLSNKAFVLIKGKRAPVIGNVCMDQLMADVTDIEGVCAGDEAILVGTDGEETVTFEELAGLAGTINYELACDISKRVPRVYYSGGKEVSSKDYFYDRY